jgi:outer membrane protein
MKKIILSILNSEKNKTMKLQKSIFIYIIFLLIIFFVFYFSKDKSGYIDNNKLYIGFKGTIELEQKLKESNNSEKLVIDSLNKVIIAVENLFKSKNPTIEEISTYKKLMTYTDSLKYVYQSNLKTVNNKISIQVWNTLNEYILEYGKKNNYMYIYGASGNGNLMYASDKKDITNDVIKFVNKKYDGK